MVAAILQFLGTGGSMGIPVVGCSCSVCRSSHSKNYRLRPSALLKVGKQNILIDAGPDFRYQALRWGVDRLDGVIFTHAHHDHTAAVDELRVYTLRSASFLPCLLSKKTLFDLKRRFYYIFEEAKGLPKLTTHFAPICLPSLSGEVDFLGLKIRYVSYEQAGMQVNGFRFGNLAYLTDIKRYDETIFQMLDGVEHLIVGALRYTDSEQHFSVDQAIAFAKKSGAEKTWLTHIAHELDHDRVNAYLPLNMRMSYDGLELHFEAERSLS